MKYFCSTRLLMVLISATLMAIVLPATQASSYNLAQVHSGKHLQLQILAINDFHGKLTEKSLVSGRPVGSAPVLASYLQTAAEGMEDSTFIVHAGDLVGASSPESALLQDEPTVEFFNLLGNRFCRYNNPMNPRCNLVGTVGNHEFDEGRQELMRLIEGGNHINGPFLQDPWRGATFPYVCTNVVDENTNRPILAPYVIKRIKDVPVAFVGAVLQDTASIVTASGIAGLQFTGEAQAINTQVRKLKHMGIKTIIVLLHQGGFQPPYEGATDPAAVELSGEVVDIVKALDSEVDVVISGHTHGFTNALIANDQGAEILVTQAWSKGTAFAGIDLEIDRQSGDVAAKSAEIITTWADAGPGLEPDRRVAELVDEAKEVTLPLTSQIIGNTAVAISADQNEAGESAMGNLIADAQRAALETDFAFMNPGGIRNSLDAGEVTWGELYSVQPFNNYLVKMELIGQQVYDLLNQQFTPYQPFDSMLQISGLTYSWDAGRPANDKVVEVRKDGVPIDRTTLYSVTVNSFMAEGGDKFTVLLDGLNRQVGPIDLDGLIEYIEYLGQPFSSAIEGRIEKLN